MTDAIMVRKLGKDPTEVESYQPISLMTIRSKWIEKLVFKRHISLLSIKKKNGAIA